MVFTHYLSGFLLMFSFFDECAAFSYTQVFKSQKSTHVGDGGPTSHISLCFNHPQVCLPSCAGAPHSARLGLGTVPGTQ